MPNIAKKIIITLFVIIFLWACDEPKTPVNIKETPFELRDRWLVLGKIADQKIANAKIMAIRADGTKYKTQSDAELSFALELPGNSTYAIYFFIDSETQGESPKNLSFENGSDVGISNTLRLPFAYNGSYLDLGEIDFSHEKAFPTSNPSLALDFDQDGLKDMEDSDDQNDGLPDARENLKDEEVIMCHFNETNKGGVNIPINLIDIYHHLSHGDFVGPCKH